MRNRTAPRKDKNKVLPHGIPELIRNNPGSFGVLDFKVCHELPCINILLNKCHFQIPVPVELLDSMEEMYAPPEHPVFQLTPPGFDIRARFLYEEMGQPIINKDSFWNTYKDLLHRFQQPAEDTELDEVLATHTETMQRLHDLSWDEIPLLEGLKELREGGLVIGEGYGDDTAGSSNGDGPEYADFTDDSSSEEE